jgi:hypothetical protein
MYVSHQNGLLLVIDTAKQAAVTGFFAAGGQVELSPDGKFFCVFGLFGGRIAVGDTTANVLVDEIAADNAVHARWTHMSVRPAGTIYAIEPLRPDGPYDPTVGSFLPTSALSPGRWRWARMDACTLRSMELPGWW